MKRRDFIGGGGKEDIRSGNGQGVQKITGRDADWGIYIGLPFTNAKLGLQGRARLLRLEDHSCCSWHAVYSSCLYLGSWYFKRRFLYNGYGELASKRL